MIPTVMKADDGYYYMYQTDASYGNAHDGHGHFHARRSKDLVNWEYMGATMKSTPTWVKRKTERISHRNGIGTDFQSCIRILGSRSTQSKNRTISYVLFNRNH